MTTELSVRARERGTAMLRERLEDRRRDLRVALRLYEGATLDPMPRRVLLGSTRAALDDLADTLAVIDRRSGAT